MAKKNKTEATIKNDEREEAVDFTAIKDDTGEAYQAKTLEVESKTTLEDDKSQGEAITLRFFEFATNPEFFRTEKNKKGRMPTPQELFNAHAKQIEIELWKDEWQPIPEVEPRIMFAKDKSHYRIVIGARPAKGSNLSLANIPQSLTQLIHGNSSTNSN